MTPWEAVSDRFGMDESDFREMHDEQRELLAFWVEGSDVGGRSWRGVDFWSAGGIDDVIALNADFAAAVAECLAVDQVAGRDAGPFDETLERLRDDWADSGHVDIDAQGVMHPADKFEKSRLKIDEYVQVKSLDSLLQWYLSDGSILLERHREVGGADLCGSSGTTSFVWTDDAKDARKDIKISMDEARKVIKAWKVKA